jgi:hypothetical protein
MPTILSYFGVINHLLCLAYVLPIENLGANISFPAEPEKDELSLDQPATAYASRGLLPAKAEALAYLDIKGKGRYEGRDG